MYIINEFLLPTNLRSPNLLHFSHKIKLMDSQIGHNWFDFFPNYANLFPKQ